MNRLIDKLKFCLSYFFLWVGYFILTRVVFICFYFEQTRELDISTLLNIFLHAFKLDLSNAAYFSVFPFLFIALLSLVPGKFVGFGIRSLTYALLFIVNLLMIIDLSLYGHWGFRLDTTFLNYLNTPDEMMASVSYGYVVLALLTWLVVSLVLAKLFNRFMNKRFKLLGKSKLWEFPLLIVFSGLLVVVMRGGLQTIPINQSDVYFSDNMFANQAAVNFSWNFAHSLSQKTDGENPYEVFSPTEALQIYGEARDAILPFDTISNQILTTSRPNVILILWESLTAKLTGPLGGDSAVIENFNRLTNEGILFTNFYANGDRTDKGLVALLSGYYPQPVGSIIKIPNKSRKLPMLTQSLADMGYTNSFYYGGDLNFSNMNTYLFGKGIQHIADGNEFDAADQNSKWGVHDHILINKISKDLSKITKEPFFTTILTLTSHEPFEFPFPYKFGDDNELNKFKSALAYTDEAIMQFIEVAKKQPWWDNTLIVITGDHGHRLPEIPNQGFKAPGDFHTPMLWLGGAIKHPGTINENFCAQTDFAYSLLNLLGADNSSFKYGNDFFSPSPNHYAHYIFNLGFGTISKEGFLVYEYHLKQPILEQGTNTDKMEKLGKAITQIAYQDFLDK